MIESHQDHLFEESKRSTLPMVLAGVCALLITGLVFAGYTLLRKRHADSGLALNTPQIQEVKPAKALITVDEALLKNGQTTLGGAVKNTSNEKLENLSVELDLKRRKDGGTETQLVPLLPATLEPQQEGRYSLQLKAQDYSSAHLSGLKSGAAALTDLAYTTASGQKRPLERLEQKTIIVNKPSKGGEFLNSPENPARVP
jgi:hypothetical protein